MTEEAAAGSSEQAAEHFSSAIPTIYRLWAEWLVQVQSADNCSAPAPLDILQSNKHGPGCQQEQLLLFRAVSFKGDELEWRGWRNQVGGSNVAVVIYEKRVGGGGGGGGLIN